MPFAYFILAKFDICHSRIYHFEKYHSKRVNSKNATPKLALFDICHSWTILPLGLFLLPTGHSLLSHPVVAIDARSWRETHLELKDDAPPSDLPPGAQRPSAATGSTLLELGGDVPLSDPPPGARRRHATAGSGRLELGGDTPPPGAARSVLFELGDDAAAGAREGRRDG